MTVFVDKRDPSSRFISVTNSMLDFKCGRLEVAQEATLDCTWLNHLCLRLKVCLLFVLQTNHEVALPSPAPPLRCPSSADGFRLQDLRVQCGKIWLQEGFKFQGVTHSDQGETAAHFAPSLDPCRFHFLFLVSIRDCFSRVVSLPLQVLSQCDIALLQEVMDEGAVTSLLASLNRYRYSNHISSIAVFCTHFLLHSGSRGGEGGFYTRGFSYTFSLQPKADCRN